MKPYNNTLNKFLAVMGFWSRLMTKKTTKKNTNAGRNNPARSNEEKFVVNSWTGKVRANPKAIVKSDGFAKQLKALKELSNLK